MHLINFEKEIKELEGVWQPKEVAFVDDYRIVISRFRGEYQFHHHDTDEFFYILRGEIEIETKDGASREKTFHLKEGEGFLMPKTTSHRSKAKNEAIVLMFEKRNLKTFFE